MSRTLQALDKLYHCLTHSSHNSHSVLGWLLLGKSDACSVPVLTFVERSSAWLSILPLSVLAKSMWISSSSYKEKTFNIEETLLSALHLHRVTRLHRSAWMQKKGPTSSIKSTLMVTHGKLKSATDLTCYTIKTESIYRCLTIPPADTVAPSGDTPVPAHWKPVYAAHIRCEHCGRWPYASWPPACSCYCGRPGGPWHRPCGTETITQMGLTSFESS